MITAHYYLHIFVCSMLMLQISGYCLLSRDFISGDFTEIVIAPGIRMIHPFFFFCLNNKSLRFLFPPWPGLNFSKSLLTIMCWEFCQVQLQTKQAHQPRAFMYPLTFSEQDLIFGQSTSGSNSSSSSSSS